MYREKYAQKRAVQLYTAGSSREAVLVMLQEEGAAPDQVEELANKYHKLYLLLRREDAKQELKTGRILTSIGAVF
ncbi:hypothetical protein Hsw_2413 [Hymenobacter swuensis DY53]|uniref:Uncharacterized protein n=1 Tax=Hymenobacter swuensis DY53 TaxID=1227739 RepID=W8EZF0_9BACT|nr:hypothetical protein Hsw_2413 [Hymenobacter swuensis DY53]